MNINPRLLSAEQFRDYAQSRGQEINEVIADICKEENVEVDDFLREYAEQQGEEALRELGLELPEVEPEAEAEEVTDAK